MPLRAERSPILRVPLALPHCFSARLRQNSGNSILRLRQNLGISSESFVEKYISWDFSHDLGFPTAKLKMSDDADKICPFLGEAGCEVYPDRPSACRIYPLARATQKHARFDRTVDAYFLVRESHCKGFEQGKEWTIEEWKKEKL